MVLLQLKRDPKAEAQWDGWDMDRGYLNPRVVKSVEEQFHADRKYIDPDKEELPRRAAAPGGTVFWGVSEFLLS